MGYTFIKLASVSVRTLSKPLIQTIKKAHLRNLKRLNFARLNGFFEMLGNLSYQLELRLNAKLFNVEDV